eukprot:3683367-Alexandrium_andersonii.AAC.1
MSASLVGSEMCIRDSASAVQAARNTRGGLDKLTMPRGANPTRAVCIRALCNCYVHARTRTHAHAHAESTVVQVPESLYP